MEGTHNLAGASQPINSRADNSSGVASPFSDGKESRKSLGFARLWITVNADGLRASERLTLLAKVGARPDKSFLEAVLFDEGPVDTVPNSNPLARVLNWFKWFLVLASERK